MSRKVTLVPIAILIALALAACGRERVASIAGLANQPPTIAFRSDPTRGGAGEFALAWTARDPDGRVDHFEVTDDPRVLRGARDVAWQRQSAAFARVSQRPKATLAAATSLDDGLSVFAVRAVDDRGAKSESAIRAFFGTNIAPQVQIVFPAPSPVTRRYVPPAIEIRWIGSDPDGFTGRPVKYKYRLFGPHDFEITLPTILTDPDSLRRYYAPIFAGWDSTSAESTFVRYQNLTLGADYVFAVVAIDEQGDYSPVFNFSTNLLNMRIVAADLNGPALTVRSPFFQYAPAVSTPPVAPRFEYPQRVAFEVNWFGTPVQGSSLSGYRWVLDPTTEPGSLTRRTLDVVHGEWSDWSLANTSASIGPFRGGAATAEHVLYIEARDEVGLTSRAVLRLVPVGQSFVKELLVVDDTRLPVTTGNVGPWPNAAELDTFLYARGGYPWVGKPAGTLSTPGLLAGYSFDTLGTRTGQADLGVPLSVLGQYRHVLWLTSKESAFNTEPGTSAANPMSALRYMSVPGRQNSLSAYVAAGGRLWLAGLPATANLVPYDRTFNNTTGQTFDSQVFPAELFPGQLTYDGSGWQSAIRVQPTLSRAPERGLGVATPAPPSAFPATIAFRTAATDPVPPGRTSGNFYLTNSTYEYILNPNSILEYALPPNGGTQESVLDSLYRIRIPSGQTFPCMTVYRGREHGMVVHTGFDLWSWRRSDCAGLMDGVLGGYWFLTRVPIGGTVAAVSAIEKRR